jgi:hypothetical protein
VEKAAKAEVVVAAKVSDIRLLFNDDHRVFQVVADEAVVVVANDPRKTVQNNGSLSPSSVV